MDLKEAGNLLFIVGQTKEEFGGSHFSLVGGCSGGEVPKVDAELAARTFAAVHQAIVAGTVRACHDLSEGGLAVALAEMAFAGGLGAQVRLGRLPCGMRASQSPPSGDEVAEEGSTPIARLTYLLIAEAVELRASEIQIEPFNDRVRIRYRIGGVLIERDSPPRRLLEPILSRIRILAGMDSAERRRPQEGQFMISVGDKQVAVRADILPTTQGESATLWLLGNENAKVDQSSNPTSRETVAQAAGFAKTQPREENARLDAVLLFSESNTRFICEVPPSKAEEFSRLLADVPHARIGEVRAEGRLEVIGTGGVPCLVADIARLKQVWQKPLDW
jgi:hypothetical protein